MFRGAIKLVCSALCALQVLWAASTGLAQDPAEPPAYRPLVSDALAEFDAGHFAEARALFLRAHTLHPSARTLRGLGLASFELREYRAAHSYLAQALASNVNPLEGELRGATEQLMERTHSFVGRFRLDLVPAEARLRIDGALTEPSPQLVLDIGLYTLDAEAPGYLSETRMLRVLGGEEQTLTFRLSPVPLPKLAEAPPRGPVATPASTPPSLLAPRTALDTQRQTDEGAGRPLYRSGWLWAGVGVAVVTAAVVAGVLARRDARSELGEPTLTGNTPPGALISALGSRP